MAMGFTIWLIRDWPAQAARTAGRQREQRLALGPQASMRRHCTGCGVWLGGAHTLRCSPYKAMLCSRCGKGVLERTALLGSA